MPIYSLSAAGAAGAAAGGGASGTGAGARAALGAGCFLAAGAGAAACAEAAAGARGAAGAALAAGAAWRAVGSGFMMLTGGVEEALGNSALVGLPVGIEGGSPVSAPGIGMAAVAAGPAGAFQVGA